MAAAAVDVVFELRGTWIPQDHGYPLYAALSARLPWLDEEAQIGVLPVKGADSGDGNLCLSRRARLVLRLPAARAGDVARLSGARLAVGGGLEVGQSKVRVLAPFPVLYSPLVVSGSGGASDDEGAFSRQVTEQLRTLGMPAGFICGRRRDVRVGDNRLSGFSLLVSELSADQSLALQSTGLAAGRRFGWGVFVPHKRIAAVGE